MLDNFAHIDRWCSYFGPEDKLRDLLNTEMLLQHGEDLGQRIANATEELFAMGYERIVALCADCPTVDTDYMQRTLAELDSSDIVFGPARDGGCLLVALSKPAAFIFSDVEMSTDHVYNDMAKLAGHNGYTSVTLEPRYDLDYLADLQDAMRAGELMQAAHTNAIFSASRFTAASAQESNGRSTNGNQPNDC